MSALRLGA